MVEVILWQYMLVLFVWEWMKVHTVRRWTKNEKKEYVHLHTWWRHVFTIDWAACIAGRWMMVHLSAGLGEDNGVPDWSSCVELVWLPVVSWLCMVSSSSLWLLSFSQTLPSLFCTGAWLSSLSSSSNALNSKCKGTANRMTWLFPRANNPAMV